MLNGILIGLASTSVGEPYVELAGVKEFSGQMIVRPIEGLRGENVDLRERSAAESALQPHLVRYVESTDEFIVNVPSGKDENQFSAQLMATGRYAYAEPDWRVYPAATPNDPKWFPTSSPSFPGQWYHNTLNTNYAFNFLGGGSQVVVAVVDTGVDALHPDLTGVCLPGRNVVPGTPDVNDTSDASTFGHGTFAAGIIGANPNNGLDICGMGWKGVGSGSSANLFRILPIRVSDSSNGVALLSTITAGIQWAADHGAKVINTSYSGFDSATVGTTGSYVRGLGAFSVWSAGNDNLQKSEVAFDHKDVLVVGGSEIDDTRWVGSNYGLCIDFFAPATQITSLKKGSGTKTPTGGGTSFSASFVTGVVAQIISRTPSLSWDNVEKRLKYGCFDMTDSTVPGATGYQPGNDAKYGWGRVHAAKSVIWPYNTSVFPAQYELTLLPLPSGFIGSASLDVNDRGQVVGYLQSESAGTRGAFWDLRAFPNAVVVPDPPGTIHSVLDSINNLGTTSMAYSTETQALVARWSMEHGHVDLPPSAYLPYTNGQPTDINDYGVITGRIYPYGGNAEAVFWDGLSSYRIGPYLPGTASSEALAVNNEGLLIGARNDSQSGFWFDGLSLTPFQNPEGGRIDPYDINDQGIAVGSSFPKAFRISRQDNVVQYYSEVPGITTDSYAFSIDEWERVVGQKTVGNSVQAYLFEGPVTGQLSQRVAPGHPFSSIWRATSTNNKGQIVGLGTVGGMTRGFIASPLADRNLQFAYNMGQQELEASGGPVYLGAIPPALSVQFRTGAGEEFPGNPTIMASYNRATGSISLESLPPEVTAPFRVFVKVDNQIPGYLGPGYLGQMTPPLSQPAFALDIRSAELVNLIQGDCDMDNEIGIGDYAILSTYYGTEDGDGRYIPTADINGDTVVDIADYAMLSQNYGLVGD